MYNSKMIVQLLDLPAGTIRAWETRYGVIQPARTKGGHRVYSDQDLSDLIWLKTQIVNKGLSISHAAEQLLKHRGTQSDGSTKLEPSPPAAEFYYVELQKNLYARLICFDTDKANALVDAGFSMYQFDDMFHKVLVPLMMRVGDEWEQGIISVAQEHFISHFVQLRFSQFFRLFEVDPAKPKALALCPAGEHHQVGLLLFSLFLRRKGLEVVYLGADTPLDGISDLMQGKNIELLCVSLTDPKRITAGMHYIESVVKKMPRLKLALGGKAFCDLPAKHVYFPYVLGESLAGWERWYQEEIVKQAIVG